jgi:hypothetical protein
LVVAVAAVRGGAPRERKQHMDGVGYTMAVRVGRADRWWTAWSLRGGSGIGTW